jgi:hypothetical protein
MLKDLLKALRLWCFKQIFMHWETCACHIIHHTLEHLIALINNDMKLTFFATFSDQYYHGIDSV